MKFKCSVKFPDFPKSKMALLDGKPFPGMLTYSCNVKFSQKFTGPNEILPDKSFGPADFGKSGMNYSHLLGFIDVLQPKMP